MKKDDVVLCERKGGRKPTVCKLISQNSKSEAWLVKNSRGHCSIVSAQFLHPCKEPWQLELGSKIETIGLGERISELAGLFKSIPLGASNKQRLFGDFVLYFLKERNEELERNRRGSGTAGECAEETTTETTDSGEAPAGDSGNAQTGKQDSSEQGGDPSPDSLISTQTILRLE